MITFIGDKSRSSGQVRGIQVAQAMSRRRTHHPRTGFAMTGNFFDVSSNSFIGHSGFHKTVIFVRSFHPQLALQLKNGGHKLGFDIIDRAVANLHGLQKNDQSITEIDWSVLTHGLIDFYVVTNQRSKKRLSQCVDSHCVHVIPHHAAPDSLVEKEDKLPCVVGYIGLPDQLHHAQEIKSHVESLGLEFFTGHPLNREECCDMLSKIDIGVIFLERNNRTGYVLDYKPNQKLSNFQCFGIPTVACDYDSFKEFGGDAYVVVKTLEEVLRAITMLVENKDTRADIRKRGYTAGKALLSTNVACYYERMLDEIE